MKYILFLFVGCFFVYLLGAFYTSNFKSIYWDADTKSACVFGFVFVAVAVVYAKAYKHFTNEKS